MSRWATTFHAHKAADTVDTVDTVAPPAGPPPHSVNRVSCVTGKIEAESDDWADAILSAGSAGRAVVKAAGRAAIEAELPPCSPAVAIEPAADMVEALASAMAAGFCHWQY